MGVCCPSDSQAGAVCRENGAERERLGLGSVPHATYEGKGWDSYPYWLGQTGVRKKKYK